MTSTDILSRKVATLEQQVRELKTIVQQTAKLLSTGGVRRGFWKAKLNATLNKDGSAAASLWYHNGTSLVDQGEDVTVYDWYLPADGTVSIGKKVVIVKMQDGKWWAIGAEEECE